MTIRVVTDSTCDLPEATRAAHDITVIPLFINIGPQSYRDGVDLSRQEFYRQLPHYPHHPTTAAPSLGMFRETYERLADEGATEVLSIHISSSLSSTVDAARLAAQQTDAVRVTVFDSRQLSMGTGFLVEMAARIAAEGRTLGEILAALDAQIARTFTAAMLDTMEYLRRSGRVNGAVAGLGNLLQIKPLLKMYEGVAGSERVRTRDQAFKRLVALVAERAPLEKLAIVHTHAAEAAEALRQQIAHLLPGGDIPSMDVTPVLGVHLGPGAVGFSSVSAGQ